MMRMDWWLVLLVLAMLAVCGGCPARAADAAVQVAQAVQLLESGDVAAARTTLQTAPATPLVLAVQGMTELADGKTAPAETLFRKALAADEQQVLGLWGLALCALCRQRVFEATILLDRAAKAAPDTPRISALQAYAYMLLGRITDAAIAGKAAMDGGEQSPFLFATLAQIYYRMGYVPKALEFGSFASRTYVGMDFLAKNRTVVLPLSMLVADTLPGTPPTRDPGVQRTELEIELPPAPPAVTARTFAISSPPAGETLTGVQRVQAVYRGTRDIKFVVFQVDGVLRGMVTDLPYQFRWDADAVAAGAHTILARAYDGRGTLMEEDTIMVTTIAGKPLTPVELPAREAELQRRLLGMSMPAPDPLSLFVFLGYWYRDQGEVPQAINAFEKAAAIDPSSENILALLAQLYAQRGLHPISANGEVTRGPGGKKRVALTFDDGPNPLYTPNILADLKRYHARGTFFLVGKMVQQYPDLTLQMLAEGHELANHSYTHPNLTKIPPQDLIAEVLRNRTTVKDVTGRDTFLFRPPGGNIDEAVTKQLRALDYNIVYWDINAGEYKKSTPAEQANQILARVQDGSILLLHNGPVDGTLTILPTLLATLTKRGYTCVTVSELMGKTGAGK